MKKYRKGLIALSGFLVVLAEALRDGSLDGGEFGYLAVATLTALGVYRVPNRTP